jgi:hypothetical protein|tara:strand:+ start:147 stop:362 length:216 start_codon:yes stop_codon:yes gene_type:complete
METIYVAYDKCCEVWIDCEQLVFVEVSKDEYKQIEDDEDKTWKSPAELIEIDDSRDRFEVIEDGTLFNYLY